MRQRRARDRLDPSSGHSVGHPVECHRRVHGRLGRQLVEIDDVQAREQRGHQPRTRVGRLGAQLMVRRRGLDDGLPAHDLALVDQVELSRLPGVIRLVSGVERDRIEHLFEV